MTNRQKELLKYIIEEYIETAKPVGSKIIIQKYMPNISSATIRSEMAKLEELEFLDKTHISSGRVPSIKAYKYYDQNILIPNVDENVINKLTTIFEQREKDIDKVIDDTLNIINEVTGLISMSCQTILSTEILRQISLITLNETNAIIITVSDLGNINKLFIDFENNHQINDIKICVDIFNEYLVGCKFCDIKNKTKEIEPIIREQVKEFEFITREVILRFFNFVDKTNASKNKKNKIVGISSIFNNPEFQDHGKLQKIIQMIEKGNIWDQINFMFKNNKESKIITCFEPDLPISITSTTLKIYNQNYKISVLGPNRVDLKLIKGILEYLNKKIEEIFNEN